MRIDLKKNYVIYTSCHIANFEVQFPVLWCELTLLILSQSAIRITFLVFYTEVVLQVYAILHVSWWKLKTGTCPTVGSWHLAQANLNWKVPQISAKLPIDTGISHGNIEEFTSIPKTWLWSIFLTISIFFDSITENSLFGERGHQQKWKNMYILITCSVTCVNLPFSAILF